LGNIPIEKRPLRFFGEGKRKVIVFRILYNQNYLQSLLMS